MTNDSPTPVSEYTRSQHAFLENLIRKKTSVMVFLINGIKLEGNLVGTEDYCIFLARDETIQLIYKHSIATISPRPYHGPFRIPDVRTIRD